MGSNVSPAGKQIVPKKQFPRWTTGRAVFEIVGLNTNRSVKSACSYELLTSVFKGIGFHTSCWG